jgi:hypothetical protein
LTHPVINHKVQFWQQTQKENMNYPKLTIEFSEPTIVVNGDFRNQLASIVTNITPIISIRTKEENQTIFFNLDNNEMLFVDVSGNKVVFSTTAEKQKELFETLKFCFKAVHNNITRMY